MILDGTLFNNIKWRNPLHFKLLHLNFNISITIVDDDKKIGLISSLILISYTLITIILLLYSY